MQHRNYTNLIYSTVGGRFLCLNIYYALLPVSQHILYSTVGVSTYNTALPLAKELQVSHHMIEYCQCLKRKSEMSDSLLL